METNTDTRLTTEEELNELKKERIRRLIEKNLEADRRRARKVAKEHGANNREVILEVVYRSEYRKHIAKIRWATDGAIFGWSKYVPTKEQGHRIGLTLIETYKLNLVETKFLKI